MMSKIGQLVTLLLCTVVVIAGTGSETRSSSLFESSDLMNPSGRLLLTTTTISKRLCFGDDQVSVLQMRLGLHYTNAGPTPIILYKGSVLVPSLAVRKTAEDAIVGKQELSLSFTTLTSKGRRINERLDDLFIVLLRGSSFDTETEVAIPFSTTATGTIPGTVTPGTHVLQVRVVTWPETAKLGKRLEGRWKKYGYLWRDVVESAPMAFEIEPNAKLQTCP